MALRDIMPLGNTLPATGCSCMLCNKDWMLPPGCLFAIVSRLSRRQASLNEALGVVHNAINPLGLELLEFFPLQPEPAPE